MDTYHFYGRFSGTCGVRYRRPALEVFSVGAPKVRNGGWLAVRIFFWPSVVELSWFISWIPG